LRFIGHRGSNRRKCTNGQSWQRGLLTSPPIKFIQIV
jgi:hypothetical protein